MEKVFRVFIAKEKVFPYICCNLRIFASECQASFPAGCCSKVVALFSSQTFPSFAGDISPHCCCRSRQIFVLQLFADFSVGTVSFTDCFFCNFLSGSSV